MVPGPPASPSSICASAASRQLCSPHPTGRWGRSLRRGSAGTSFPSIRSRRFPGWPILSKSQCLALSTSEDAGAAREESSAAETVSAKEIGADGGKEAAERSVGIGSPSLPLRLGAIRMSVGDQAFLILAVIACTTSVAFTSLVIAVIPTLYAIKRAAISLSKLADTAREELPSTMAAIRLSGMEISDLTLELNDLSQEIADGVNKSAQAVQAADAGIRKIGRLARQQTMAMIEERASLPDIGIRPVVAGAARKASDVVGRVGETFLGIVSGGGGYISDGDSVPDKPGR